jgi:hypothetical protein
MCPEGWVAKYNVGGGWENPSGGSFSMMVSGGFNRGVDSIGSTTHNLTGFCVKSGTEVTGILPMSALPWEAGEHDASHYALYAEEIQPTPTPTPEPKPKLSVGHC